MYKLIDDRDANFSIELESDNVQDAALEALAHIGYRVVEVEEEDQ